MGLLVTQLTGLELRGGVRINILFILPFSIYPTFLLFLLLSCVVYTTSVYYCVLNCVHRGDSPMGIISLAYLWL